MRNSRLINGGIKFLVLLFALALLIHLWHTNLSPVPPVGGGDNDEDDVKYAPRVPVSVAPIGRATLHKYVVAYGIVEPEPGAAGKPPAIAEIKVPTPSLVSEVTCVEGQHVEAGQSLFKLDPRPVNAAIESARRSLAIANESLSRFQQTAKDDKVAGQWLLQAQRDRDLAQSELDRALGQQAMLTIASPLAGTVTQLQIRPGEIADASAPAVVIVDLSRLVVASSVAGPELKEIQLGQDARILLGAVTSPTTQAGPTSEPSLVIGKVTLIDRQIDAKTGLGSVDVSAPPDARLRPGDFVSVQIVTATHADCLVVPTTSIVRDIEGQPGVSLAVRDFQWAFRHPVRLGFTDDDQVEVDGEGIEVGQYVVTTGAYALPDKSRIDIGSSSMRGGIGNEPSSQPLPAR